MNRCVSLRWALFFLISTLMSSAHGGREHFIGFWVNDNPNSLIPTMRLGSNLSVQLPHHQTSVLVTYGTAGRVDPIYHTMGRVLANWAPGQSTLILFLGGTFQDRQNLDLDRIDVLRLFDSGPTIDDYGNIVTRDIFRRAKFPKKPLRLKIPRKR